MDTADRKTLRKSEKSAIIASPMKNKGGVIMGRPNKYTDMSKEEIIAEMQAKSRERDASKWKKTVTMTKSEGEFLETEILPSFNCVNPSQLLKKIVNGELIVSPAESDS